MKDLTPSQLTLCYALILIAFVLHIVYLSCVAEDSHITFRYAMHLAEGHGIVWNIGETPPVEGYTNFLWLLIISVFIWIGLDIFVASVVTGAIAAIATIELSRRFAVRFLGCNRLASLVPALFLAFSGPMATWAGSGMETALFGTMVMSAIYFFAGYWTSDSRLELSLSFGAAFLATLLRPEGLMIFCLLVGLSAVMSFGNLRKFFADHLLPVLVFSIPFCIYFIWRLNYFGDPLPNTFYAKTGGGIAQYFRGTQYLANFFGYFLLPLFLPLLLALWELGFPQRPRQLSLTWWRSFARENIGWLVIATVLPVYLAYILSVGGDYMAMYRFLVPVLPLIYLLLAAVFARLLIALANNPHKKVLALLSLAIAAGATAFHSTPFEQYIFKQPGRQHGHYRGVQTERWHVARLTEIGKFFNEYKQGSDESLATRAIGAIGYYADLRVDDLMGLADPVIAHKKSESDGSGWAGHEKLDLDYSFGRLPTFFMFDRNLQANLSHDPSKQDDVIDIANFLEQNYPAGARRFAGWIRENAEFVKANYKVTSVWMVDSENAEEGYFSFLELRERL